MAGMKFGATGQEALTWAMNAYVPALVCEKYARSRIVAYSTGNIYGLAPLGGGGSVESDEPNPVGDYAMSCLGRERIFQHFAMAHKTPVTMFRLNYACECRYGVLVDLARKVWNSQPIDLAMGYFNVIWQGDAVAMSIQALERAASPAAAINVTGPEILRVRDVCEKLGRLMNRKVTFVGSESPHALLSNAGLALELFGRPRVSADQLMQMVASWVSRGGRSLGKPTHFEVRDGKF
jgi:nucleoside-diphosphate-sugar epimerase